MHTAGVEWRRVSGAARRTVAVLGIAILGFAPAAHARRPHGSDTAPAKESAAAAEPYQAAILMEAATGNVLIEKNAHQKAPPASMTKMMLMLLVAERVQRGDLTWDTPITASRLASKMGGSQVFLKEGEVFPLGEMMQAIVIHSANDASLAVAETVGGTVEAFVEMMNDRAKELGLQDTEYQTPHGLPPASGQKSDLTSAYDLATLARELVKYPDIMKWARTPSATFRNGTFEMLNTNHLVRTSSWIDGLKTGFHREAGFCITATGERDGLRLISVIMGSPRKQQSFDEAAKLLAKGFATYKSIVAVKKGDVVATDVLVKMGKPRFIRVLTGGNLTVLGQKTEKRAFTLELALPRELQAPIAANAVVGEVIVKEDGHPIGKVPAVAAEAVEKETSLLERIF